MRVKHFIFLKDRITPADVAGVVLLVQEINENPKDRVLNFVNKRKIIKLLTTRKHFIFYYDFIFIKDIFKAAGLTGESSIKVENAVQKLMDLGAFLASHLGGTGYQILSNITANEIDTHVRAIAIKKLEGFMAMIKSAHLPKDFLTEINKELEKFDTEKQDRIKRIAEESERRYNEKKMKGEIKNGEIQGNPRKSKTRNNVTGREYITELLAAGIRA